MIERRPKSDAANPIFIGRLNRSRRSRFASARRRRLPLVCAVRARRRGPQALTKNLKQRADEITAQDQTTLTSGL